MCRGLLRDKGICLGWLCCMVPPTLVVHVWVKIRCFGGMALFGSMGAAAIEHDQCLGLTGFSCCGWKADLWWWCLIVVGGCFLA